MANPVSETQSINPGSVIELFELTTDAALHGSATTYRFHAGTNEVNNGNIIWDGNTYIAIPMEADGFKYANGQLPRPTLTISNVTNVITAILLNVNQVTPGNDLTGAGVKRRTTLARFLDSANFDPVATTTTSTSTIADPSDVETVTYTATLTISNALGTITSILLTVNSTTTGNDLTGATVTRIRTLARFIDAVNFPGDINPYGTPDPTAEYPQQIYKIDRKSAENRAVVQFELAASFDLANIRIPLRVCTKQLFPSIGTFMP